VDGFFALQNLLKDGIAALEERWRFCFKGWRFDIIHALKDGVLTLYMH